MKRWKQAMLAAWAGGANPMAYTNKVIALGPIAYWPLADAAGPTMLDESGNGRNGVYGANVTLGATGIGDGRTAASFPGTGAGNYANAYTAGFAGAFNGSEGALSAWFQVQSAAVWTDGVSHFILQLFTDANNRILIDKSTTNNTLRVRYIAGGTNKAPSPSISATAWTHLGITWSKSADQLKVYLSGVQSGSTQTGLGTWAGSLTVTGQIIGATDTSGSNPWKGNLAHVAVWATPLDAPTIASLATVP